MMNRSRVAPELRRSTTWRPLAHTRSCQILAGRFGGWVCALIVVSGCASMSSGGASHADTNPIVARISMSGFPYDISIAPGSPTVYVLNAAGKVSVIDSASNRLVGTIQMRHQISRIAVARDGEHAYGSNQDDGLISVIDTKTRQEVSTIDVEGHPGALAVSPDSTLLYVTDLNRRSVSVVDLATQQVGDPIHLPGFLPLDIAIAPSGHWAYVVGCTGFCTTGTLWIIDTTTNTAVSSVSVGGYPTRLAVSPDGALIYVTNQGDATVSVINATIHSVAITIPVQPTPMGVAISSDGTRAYVANLSAGTVSVINTQQSLVVATVPVGVAPKAVALTSDGAFAYVANFNNVAVVDTRRIITTAPDPSSSNQ
jgi:YVTN family beta-propeller protein